MNGPSDWYIPQPSLISWPPAPYRIELFPYPLFSREKCAALDVFNPAIRVCVIPQTYRRNIEPVRAGFFRGDLFIGLGITYGRLIYYSVFRFEFNLNYEWIDIKGFCKIFRNKVSCMKDQTIGQWYVAKIHGTSSGWSFILDEYFSLRHSRKIYQLSTLQIFT